MTSDYSGNIPVPGRILHAVLPLAIRGGKEHEDLTRARTLVASLRAGFERSQRLIVNVVGRGGELDDIRTALEPLACPWLGIALHDELDVFPEMAGVPLNGWFKQQLIKMSVPEWLDCDHWLTLDADTVCVRRFAIEDLLSQGRALVRLISTRNSPLYRAWATASAEVLGYESFDLERIMDMTPVVYTRAIMAGLHREIEKVHGMSWRQALLGSKTLEYRLDGLFAGWAEMVLYQLFADRYGLWAWHHSVNGLHTDDRLLAEGSIWDAGQIANWTPQAAFSRSAPGYFIVCGSHTGVAARHVSEQVAPYLAALEGQQRQPIRRAAPPPATDTSEALQFVCQIASEPPIYFSVPCPGAPMGIATLISPLLADAPVFFLLGLWWVYDEEHDVRPIVEAYRDWQPRYPNHVLTVLCNTQEQVVMFSRAGISCVLCPQNMFVDENLFRPDPTQVRRFDAIYNAGITPFKRHMLSRDVPSLALLYGNWHTKTDEDRRYIETVRQGLPQALFINDAVGKGKYVSLDPAQCAHWYNQARVGLCLSEVEGAMYVSMEYLMCGLPVVSTPSRGGRDHFFDAEVALIVEPDARAVAAGVAEMIGRKLSPMAIRQRTLAKVEAERRKFLGLLQVIFASVNVPFPGDSIWRSFFVHKLIEPVRTRDVPHFVLHRRRKADAAG